MLCSAGVKNTFTFRLRDDKVYHWSSEDLRPLFQANYPTKLPLFERTIYSLISALFCSRVSVHVVPPHSQFGCRCQENRRSIWSWVGKDFNNLWVNPRSRLWWLWVLSPPPRAKLCRTGPEIRSIGNVFAKLLSPSRVSALKLFMIDWTCLGSKALGCLQPREYQPTWRWSGWLIEWEVGNPEGLWSPMPPRLRYHPTDYWSRWEL